MWAQTVELVGDLPHWLNVMETRRDGTVRCLGGFQTSEPDWQRARNDLVGRVRELRPLPSDQSTYWLQLGAC